MATSREYIDWVCERLAPYGEVRPRAMFGEYIVSLNGKNVVSVCDNCVFVKELPALAEAFRGAERGFPYDGAKEHYILDMDDRALLDEVVPLLETHMPLPKMSVCPVPGCSSSSGLCTLPLAHTILRGVM